MGNAESLLVISDSDDEEEREEKEKRRRRRKQKQLEALAKAARDRGEGGELGPGDMGHDGAGTPLGEDDSPLGDEPDGEEHSQSEPLAQAKAPKSRSPLPLSVPPSEGLFTNGHVAREGTPQDGAGPSQRSPPPDLSPPHPLDVQAIAPPSSRRQQPSPRPGTGVPEAVPASEQGPRQQGGAVEPSPRIAVVGGAFGGALVKGPRMVSPTGKVSLVESEITPVEPQPGAGQEALPVVSLHGVVFKKPADVQQQQQHHKSQEQQHQKEQQQHRDLHAEKQRQQQHEQRKQVSPREQQQQLEQQKQQQEHKKQPSPQADPEIASAIIQQAKAAAVATAAAASSAVDSQSLMMSLLGLRPDPGPTKTGTGTGTVTGADGRTKKVYGAAYPLPVKESHSGPVTPGKGHSEQEQGGEAALRAQGRSQSARSVGDGSGGGGAGQPLVARGVEEGALTSGQGGAGQAWEQGRAQDDAIPHQGPTKGGDTKQDEGREGEEGGERGQGEEGEDEGLSTPKAADMDDDEGDDFNDAEEAFGTPRTSSPTGSVVSDLGSLDSAMGFRPYRPRQSPTPTRSAALSSQFKGDTGASLPLSQFKEDTGTSAALSTHFEGEAGAPAAPPSHSRGDSGDFKPQAAPNRGRAGRSGMSEISPRTPSWGPGGQGGTQNLPGGQGGPPGLAVKAPPFGWPMGSSKSHDSQFPPRSGSAGKGTAGNFLLFSPGGSPCYTFAVMQGDDPTTADALSSQGSMNSACGTVPPGILTDDMLDVLEQDPTLRRVLEAPDGKLHVSEAVLAFQARGEAGGGTLQGLGGSTSSLDRGTPKEAGGAAPSLSDRRSKGGREGPGEGAAAREGVSRDSKEGEGDKGQGPEGEGAKGGGGEVEEEEERLRRRALNGEEGEEERLRRGVLRELRRKKKKMLEEKGAQRPLPLWVVRKTEDMRDLCIEFHIIRHAEFEQDAFQVVGGRSPLVPLTPRGVLQAQSLGRALRQRGVRFREMFSCPILRCQETARIVCQELGSFSLEDLVTEDALQEQSQGEWEGKKREEIHLWGMLPRITALQPDFAAPGGESQRQVEYRMVEFITRLALNRSNLIAEGSLPYQIRNAAPPHATKATAPTPFSLTKSKPEGYAIGIFSHSTAIKCLLRGILGSAPQFTHRIEIEHTSVTLLKYYALSGWRLGKVNDASHFLMPEDC